MVIAKNNRVLIVDDNHAIHDDMRKILVGGASLELGALEGALFGETQPVADRYEVDSAYHGEEGFEMTCAAQRAGRPYALAFIDMRMPPGWDGVRTIEAIWREDPEIHVVICTAYSDSTWEDVLLHLGSVDRLLILKKPFDRAEVSQLACALTEKWRLAHQSKMRVAELRAVVDEQTRQLEVLYRDLKQSSETALARKSAELEQSLALAYAIQEAVGEGILVVDAERKVVGFNSLFVELWSIPKELVERRDDASLIQSVLDNLIDPAEFVARVEHLYLHPEESSRDDIFLKNGSVFERRTAPVHAARTMQSRLWCFQDVTEKRRAESERMQTLERLTSMGRLAAGVGHEINNPLTYVRANLVELAESMRASRGSAGAPAFETADELLSNAMIGVERIRAVVSDLQTLARPRDGGHVLVDVERVLDQSIQIARNEIRHRAELVRRYANVPQIYANGERLGQVFLNLLMNAAQAIPEGRAALNRIVVLLSTLEDGQVAVEVQNTGGKIPYDQVGRLFDPSFTTKAVGAGTGLGLSICKSIVEAHRGTITVSSDDAGTSFRVVLPVGVAEPVAVDDRAPSPRCDRSGRILIIEDEPLTAKVISRVLAQSHQVVTCAAASEALAHLTRGERFDAIVCDLMMPDLSGMDMYAELVRERPALAPKMIFVTGGASTQRAHDFLASVPNPRLTKPFDSETLQRVVGEVVAQ